MRRPALLAALVLSAAAAPAATGPTLVNYQGVLRDALNHPLSGSYDMVFTFFSAAASGDEILKDSHVAAAGVAVTVTGGLFDVTLGGGAILDGSGPGTYTSLADVFADYGEVWMQITVGAETLAPRVRVVSAAYALNATRLAGKPASGFLDTSGGPQTKAGPLTLSSTAAGAYGLTASGTSGGALLRDADGTGACYAGYGYTGVLAQGSIMGGQFEDTDSSGLAYLAWGNTGVRAEGSTQGAYLKDSDSSGYAYVGYGNTGIEAAGSYAGGYFHDTDSTGYGYVGYGDYGVRAAGSYFGGWFNDTDGTGYVYLGYDDRGVYARGSLYGGSFGDSDGTGVAYAGYGDVGLDGRGASAGGVFQDTDGTGVAHVGYGDYGIEASGSHAAGHFLGAGADGTSEAFVGYDEYGIMARGSYAGAYLLNSAHSGQAYLAFGDSGIVASGETYGGSFKDDSSWTETTISDGSYSVLGNGTKSFVQNHPADPTKVLAYVALEGDEAGTYTRGTGRLVDGEARIGLGETFRWVTNPDVGLTAQVTPRGAEAVLYVASLSTEELVVRAGAGSPPDARFDFVVMGLRLGFEDLAIVRDRVRAAPLPNRDEDRAETARDPARRETTALARFARMREQAGESGALDLARSQRLASAVGTAAPGRVEKEEPERRPAEPVVASGPQEDLRARSFRAAGPEMAGEFPVDEAVRPGDVLVLDPERPGTGRLARAAADRGVIGVVAADAGVVLGEKDPAAGRVLAVIVGVTTCRVDAAYGPVRPGDLLVTSPTPGHAMRADDPAPGTVLGKALEPLEQGAGLVGVLVMLR